MSQLRTEQRQERQDFRAEEGQVER